jgi:flagellar M-ring protein FliF
MSNQSFLRPEPVEALSGPPIWQQPWIPALTRYGAAAVAIVLLLMLVVRPVLKSLATVPASQLVYADSGQVLVAGPGAPAALPLGSRGRDGSPLGRARQVAEEDPRLVANVVRQWMNSDAS